MGEAERVTDHYLSVIDQVQARRLACEPSIKLTQLGLDVDPDRAAIPGVVAPDTLPAFERNGAIMPPRVGGRK